MPHAHWSQKKYVVHHCRQLETAVDQIGMRCTCLPASYEKAKLPADKAFIPVEYEGSNSITHLGTVLNKRSVREAQTERRWEGDGKGDNVTACDIFFMLATSVGPSRLDSLNSSFSSNTKGRKRNRGDPMLSPLNGASLSTRFSTLRHHIDDWILCAYLYPCRKRSGERTVSGYRTRVRYKIQFDTIELRFRTGAGAIAQPRPAVHFRA